MLDSEVDKTNDEDFKRLLGVRKDTYRAMVEIHRKALHDNKKRKNFGRPRALNPENEVLLTLTYYREYRTYLSTAQSYKVDESTAFRVIHTVEKNLIQHPDFQLPGKKVLREERDSALIIDVTESQIERPKKTEKEV
ncbi:transposase family protein [Armatimonas sp.]|uniref:helix-turn-helix domain-containing protein n=1 Tax=Armatimonas sp. TaxID=1872638 RepID=UPI0037504423